MKVIGITGTFGSGKSEAAKMFASLGAYLIDHDKINHDILKKGCTGYDALLKEYGVGILGDDDEIERAKVAEVAFNSLQSVKRIGEILHPLIIKEEKESVEKYKREGKYDMIVFDTPLLFEAKRNEACDYTVVILANEENIFKRMEKKFGLGKDDVKRRMNLQMSLDEKVRLSDFVIENNGTLEELKENVKTLYNKISGGQV